MIRTDLAVETREMLDGDGDIDGVSMTTEQDEENGITVTWVTITNQHGAKTMGRPVGNYVTIECEAMRGNDADVHEELVKVLSRKLDLLKPLDRDATVLVVGLGNRFVTPDALGPAVCAKILVTRHMASDVPEELNGNVRVVSALTPGVMGVTGIESGEIVKGVVEKVKPDVVIAVDALAARKSSRVNATVQMTDTGVSPGAGMGSRRMKLDEETLGVPVIAIGVPTVVDAATLVNDALESMLRSMTKASQKGEALHKLLTELEDEDKYKLIRDVLPDNMFVTPKDIDATMNRLANIVGNALNITLHPGISPEDINRFFV